MTIRKNDFGGGRSFHGITVDCRMPRLFYGVASAYYICEDAFCRLEEEFLKKIRTIARFCENGSLSFRVGRNKLPQFYYSVLPQLEGAVDIMEENAEEIAAYLPPQAEFVFYLDAEGEDMSCRVGARYGEASSALWKPATEDNPRSLSGKEPEKVRRFSWQGSGSPIGTRGNRS